MNIKKKLSNPFALVIEGFVAGAIIFYATAPGDSDPQQSVQPLQSAAAAKISRV